MEMFQFSSLNSSHPLLSQLWTQSVLYVCVSTYSLRFSENTISSEIHHFSPLNTWLPQLFVPSSVLILTILYYSYLPAQVQELVKKKTKLYPYDLG